MFNRRHVIRVFAGGISLLTALTTVWVLDHVVLARTLPLEAPFPPPMPPHTQVEFQTSEFHFFVRTNALGLRDQEIDWTHKPAYRVLAIGDSFTLGWGVDADSSWPTLLKSNLRRSGRRVEVVNA
jgi:hypothetical protein